MSTRTRTNKTKFWIKQRYNPQLGTFYVPCGQLSKQEAKKMEKPLHGSNTMIPFDSEEEYRARLAELKGEGKSVLN